MRPRRRQRFRWTSRHGGAHARVGGRFGMRTMLVATAFYGILFAGLKMMLMPPLAAVMIVVWITLVGLGQMVLFHGRRGEASVLIGAVTAGLLAMCGAAMDVVNSGPPSLSDVFLGMTAIVGLSLVGGLMGYPAGCIAAGVFLLGGERGYEDEVGSLAERRWTRVKTEKLQELGLTVTSQPTFTTERLILRPLAAFDAEEIRSQAGQREIAATTLAIPHPYPEGVAERWIAALAGKFERGEEAVFGVVLQAESRLIGAVGLRIEQEHQAAEMGYWIGKDYWGQGYATEAARVVLRYGFECWRLHRIYAHHMGKNPASGRVLQKLGMQHEGRLRQHIQKWGVREDLEFYGILRSEWVGGERG